MIPHWQSSRIRQDLSSLGPDWTNLVNVKLRHIFHIDGVVLVPWSPLALLGFLASSSRAFSKHLRSGTMLDRLETSRQGPSCYPLSHWSYQTTFESPLWPSHPPSLILRRWFRPCLQPIPWSTWSRKVSVHVAQPLCRQALLRKGGIPFSWSWW